MELLGTDRYLRTIGALASEWHRCSCALSNLELSGDRRLVRRLLRLEELLEKAWQRRRRLLALAYARLLAEALLVEPFGREERRELLHIPPVC
jgi:hypothetical protein